MKLKFGAIVVDGRNKIGGHVASKNRSGAYLRTKVTPVNPATAAQVAARASLASLSQGWRALTEAQRDSWNGAVASFAKTDIFGDLKNPSGFNLYVQLNRNLAAINVAAISTAPQLTAVSIFSSITGASLDTTGGFGFTVGPATIPASESVIVRATAPQSAGKSFVKSEFRQIGVVTAAVAGMFSIDAMYAAVFGSSTPLGSKVFVEFIHVNETSGQRSQAQQVVFTAEE